MSTITLFNARQGHQAIAEVWQAIKPLLQAGKRLRLSVKEEPRTLPQNDHMQKLVRNIGAKIGRSDHDRLRAVLMEQWCHEQSRPPMHVPSFDGLRMVDVSYRTSELDKPEGSEFIEWLIATDAGL